MHRKICRVFLLPALLFIVSCAVIVPSLFVSVTGKGRVEYDQHAVRSGRPVTLTAIPGFGSKFDHWEGALSGSENPAALFMDGNKSVVGVFTLEWLFDSQSGWSFHSSPAVGLDDVVYIGSDDKNLYAINPDASLKWTFATNGRLFAGPAVAEDGTIYVGSQDGSLYAVSPQGEQVWSYYTGGAIETTPAIAADGTVYFGARNSTVYALNPNGTLKWSFPVEGWMTNVTSAPAIDAAGTIYIGADNYLYAIDSNGTEKWSLYIPQGSFSSTAIGADGTIFSDSFEKLYAINPDGSLKWTFTADGSVCGSPSLAPDGTIYVGSADGMLHALRSDGSPIWEVGTGGGTISSSPAIGSDGTIYVGCSNGLNAGLLAFRPSGSEKAKFASQDGATNPVISDTGMIYFGSGESVIGVSVDSVGPAASAWPMFRQNARRTGLQPAE